jgi:hypothetical protein
MSQRKKTPRNKTPKKKMKNDPLYQAVENMIPKPPTKQQRGGGDNFLCDIENMLKGKGKNTDTGVIEKTTPDEGNNTDGAIVIKTKKYPLDGSPPENTTSIFSFIGPVITKTDETKTVKLNGGRGKKYITNQRLSENPFSEIL